MIVGHTALQQFKACHELFSLTMVSVEEQQAFSFSRSYYLISQTSCVLQGARLGRIKKEDTSGRKGYG